MTTHNAISNRTAVLLLAVLCSSVCMGQGGTTTGYRELKEYEGNYQYLNNTRLALAASPKENVLFAIIGEARYPLKRVTKDVFLDGSNTEVRFERDKARRITGYRLGGQDTGQLFRRLSGGAFPEKMWYARVPPRGRKFEFRYSVPNDLHDGLRVGPMLSSGLDPAAVKEMVERIADGTHEDVHGILIVKDGRLVLEEYFYEYDAARPHQMRSVTKSFISALVGIAIDKGLIKGVKEKALAFFPEYELKNVSADKREITVEDLLTHRSGLDCDDDDANSPGNEVKMGASDDWVRFTLDLPMADRPGRRAKYCSGGVIVLGRIVEKVAGGSINDFAARHLFKPLGIRNFGGDLSPTAPAPRASAS